VIQVCNFFRKDYTDFAKVCFENFGDKVKNWLTFNEPQTFTTFSYGTGVFAPGRCSPGEKCAQPIANSLTEPYIAGHNILRAHAMTVDLYNKNYKVTTHSSKLIVSSTYYNMYSYIID
jgi:beta-glucosidase/6-phospho-beta-glucosidase/beta-galactosidase